MEQKTTISKPIQLLKHMLKEKKNWGILTIAIILVTVLVIPFLVRDVIGGQVFLREEFIIMGVIEVVVVVILNCLIDFNYLHDTRKFGYFASKPIDEVKKVNMVIISNLIFGMIFIAGLFVLSAIGGNDLEIVYLVPVAWMFLLVFTIALSSILSGNTLIAALASAFNFLLPLMGLGVMFFAMEIVSDITIGFSVHQIMDYVTSNIYKLDVIYLTKYVDDFGIFYFIVLAIECGFIYGLTIWALKKRKNERIGEFIIFKGFKYLVALMFSIIIPFIFTSVINTNDFLSNLLTFVVLGTLTYYISMVILNKSFKLKKDAFKLLIAFMVIFIVIVTVSGFAIKSVEKDIPALEEIDHVFLATTSSVYVANMERDGYYINLYRVGEEEISKYNLPTYKSKESIEKILDIHQTVLDYEEINRYLTFNVVYFLKDGSVMRRYYDIRPNYYDDYEEKSYDIEPQLLALANSKENIEVNYPFVYNADYRSMYKDINISYYKQSVKKEFTYNLSRQEVDMFAAAMKKDLNDYFAVAELESYYIGFDGSDRGINRPVEINKGNASDEEFYLQVLNDGYRLLGYSVPYHFTYTREFLQKLEQSN